MGIGEAMVTVLGEKGMPTPLAHTLVKAPGTRMDILAPAELQALVAISQLGPKYDQVLNRESASELLAKRLKEHQDAEEEPRKREPSKPAKEEPGWVEQASKNTMVRQLGRTALREITRGLLGVIGIRTRRR